MPDIIHLLSDSLANQIAAGEVVQRPASVLKELLENSIDAGSSKIQVMIKDSGKALVQVIDNGQGMSATDARMSFERHATSKISKTDDLFEIRTMGFRGEALASIAAVAQVEMKTKTIHEELGVSISMAGSELKNQEPTSTPQGTSTSVRNLFYNVPARRNFLKSNPVEMRHLVEEFQRIALSHPEIEFSFHQNDLSVYDLKPGKLSQRIVQIFGKTYREQLVACTEETDHAQVHGYLGKPEHAKKTRGEQFFFVNKRFIKNPYLNHAVMNGFQGLLPEDSFPFYVLFIEIDPHHTDVNVHPTKTEIKFDDERTIYGIIQASVKQALGTHHVAPSIDFNLDVNFQGIQSVRPDSASLETLTRRDYEQFRNTPLERRNLGSWETLYTKGAAGRESGTDLEKEAIRFESAANKSDLEKAGGYEPDRQATLFQIHNRFIVTQVKSGMILVDQFSAHERILFERFLEDLTNKTGASQQFLFPQTLELNPNNFALVQELEEEIKALGFNFDYFGKTTVVINGMPANLDVNEKEIFEGLIEQFKENKSKLDVGKIENIARSLAKRSAVHPGQKLDDREMNTLIDQLFGCQNPNYSPDGRRTFLILDVDQIADFFNK